MTRRLLGRLLDDSTCDCDCVQRLQRGMDLLLDPPVVAIRVTEEPGDVVGLPDNRAAAAVRPGVVQLRAGSVAVGGEGLQQLGPQTDGLVDWQDLTALPCSHPHCCSVGYLLRTDTGDWRSLTRIIGHDQLKQHLDLVSNRIGDWQMGPQMRTTVKQSLLGLLSNEASLAQPQVWGLLRDVCQNCDLGMPTLVRLASEGLTGNNKKIRQLMGDRIKRITVKPFMDINTMIEERLTQCCVHVGTQADDDAQQCAPFCAVQAWAPLGEQKLARRAVAAELGLPRPAAGPIDLTVASSEEITR